MENTIKNILDNHLQLTITPKLAEAIVKFVKVYEIRGTHGEAFNSPYLGLHQCFFLNSDRDNFFSLLNCDVKDMDKLVKKYCKNRTVFGIRMNVFQQFMSQMYKSMPSTLLGLVPSEMRKLILQMDNIDETFKVVSDPFNILTVYLLHKIENANLPAKLKRECLIAVIMLLQYKFFTSLVNHRFKYKPDEEVMRAMFERMSNKFDIKQLGSWRAVMISRAEQLIDKDSIHIDSIKLFNDDKKILYVITDIQTRIRNQINIVTEFFMEAKADNDRMGTYSHTGTNTEGEKVIMANTDGFDMMIANLANDTLSVSRLLDEQAMRITVSLFKGVSIQKLRSLLIGFSEYSVKHVKNGKQDLIQKQDDIDICVGHRILIQNLIQKTYRYCIQTKVDLNQKISIVKAVKDVYSSSRISDPGILQVKTSVDLIIQQLSDSKREATLSSFRISFILYLIILSFKYLK